MEKVNVILTIGALIYSKVARDSDKVDAKATRITNSREDYIKEISSDFNTITNQTKSLIDLQDILIQLESRITSILSDYTSLLNQISIVSTLMLGVATSTFGALLGNTEDQPMWKVNMYVISCVLTVCFSIISVIESFFLSIHIYAEESKFTAGIYPHPLKGTRSFNIEMLKGLSKSYSASILTFFISFLFFSTTLLGIVYIGLGKSMFIVGEDTRMYKSNSDRFVNISTLSVTDKEPGYTTIALLMTIIVGITYLIIIGLFLTKYRKYVLWPRKILECCNVNKESLKEPMRATAADFQRLQIDLHHEWREWERLFNTFIDKYDEIFAEKNWINRDLERHPSSDSMEWNYEDIDYEMYIYKSFKDQLNIQRKTLIQMRMLQVTDVNKRKRLISVRIKGEEKKASYSLNNELLNF